jgi:hypothetical protein
LDADSDHGTESGASADESGEEDDEPEYDGPPVLEWLFDDVNEADESDYEHLYDEPEFANYLIDCAVRRGIVPPENRYRWKVRLRVVPRPDVGDVGDADDEHGDGANGDRTLDK